ncbi:ubiquitin-activating enzyme E1 [Nematocida sp. ERTm5]|nr:ubiquitin-activating enzyme E1 [Nematocida sp. ERTm5]
MKETHAETTPGDKIFSPKVDESLYSRQIYVMGNEAMKRMLSSHVLVLGLCNAGLEIVKNISLAGIKTISIYDPLPLKADHLSTLFYCTESDIGDRIDKSAEYKLKELNTQVKIEVLECIPEDIRMYSAVVVNDKSVPEQIRINDQCRVHNIPFISVQCRGLFFQVFCDFGDGFITSDTNGEAPYTGTIKCVTPTGMVSLVEEERHSLEDGDEIEIKSVNARYTVTDTKAFTFSLCGYSGEDLSGMTFEQIKKKKVISCKSLKDSVVHPVIQTEGREASVLHKCFMYEHVSQGMDAYLQAHPTEIEDIPVVEEYFRAPAITIAPIASVAGGIAAHEVLKACSGKFTPIHQFMYFHVMELLNAIRKSKSTQPHEKTIESHEGSSQNEEGTGTSTSTSTSAGTSTSTGTKGVQDKSVNISSESVKDTQSMRYTPLEQIFGQDSLYKIHKAGVFIVGAGAIGCEHIKNISMLGMGRSGTRVITDMDAIEKSNLNRQFLFRAHDISAMKSVVAAREGDALNPGAPQNIQAYTTRVGKEAEHLFNDEFFGRIDIVLNALDNVDARLYMDNRAVYHRVPVIDAGTLGSKGHTQTIIPYITEHYGNSNDPQEKSIPLCTIRNFPYLPVHCVEWALADFKTLFYERIVEGKDALSTLGVEPLSEAMHTLLFSAPKTPSDAVKEAVHLFQERFTEGPNKLCESFPKDHVTEEGTPFWVPPKRMPSPETLSFNDPLHTGYLRSAYYLICRTLGVPGDVSYEDALKIYQNPDTSPTTRTPPQESDRPSVILTEEEFEKDSSTNSHVEYVAFASNIRAKIYGISSLDILEVKRISGRIIPAIATTTSVVSGLAVLECIKYLITKPTDVSDKSLSEPSDDSIFRNSFVSLALSVLMQSEPIPPYKEKVALPNKEIFVSPWDLVEVQDIPLSEIMHKLGDEWGVEIHTVMSDLTVLYCSFYNAAKFKQNLSKTPSEILYPMGIPVGVRSARIDMVVEGEDGNDLPVPFVKVIFTESTNTA